MLFRGTVFDNVAKGLVDEQKALSHEEQFKLVEEACKASNAHDFILEQPKVSLTGFHAGLLYTDMNRATIPLLASEPAP